MEGVASGCPLFRGKNVRSSAVGTETSVCCLEFRGGRFSEVANVLHKRDFQSVTGTLSALGRDQVEYTAGARYALSACGYAIRPRPPLNIHKATPLCSQTSLQSDGAHLSCTQSHASPPRGNVTSATPTNIFASSRMRLRVVALCFTTLSLLFVNF